MGSLGETCQDRGHELRVVSWGKLAKPAHWDSSQHPSVFSGKDAPLFLLSDLEPLLLLFLKFLQLKLSNIQRCHILGWLILTPFALVNAFLGQVLKSVVICRYNLFLKS